MRRPLSENVEEFVELHLKTTVVVLKETVRIHGWKNENKEGKRKRREKVASLL